MGKVSRKNYEAMAGMAAYTEALKELFGSAGKDEKKSCAHMEILEGGNAGEIGKEPSLRGDGGVLVSLTSHPGRIATVGTCVKSLLSQTVKPQKILLWLSEEQFPGKGKELPEELLRLGNEGLEIRWVKGDLKPHKKYFYAMREYPDAPVVTVDDDVIYNPKLLECLLKSYASFPHCVSCMSANLMLFRPDGTLRAYDNWQYDYKALRDTPSYQLMATGVGGVLYPPHCFDADAFDETAIRDVCLFCDDLWLKWNEIRQQIRTVVPQETAGYKEIPLTQDTALWRLNVNRDNNDRCNEKILSHMESKYGNREILMETVRKDRFC